MRTLPWLTVLAVAALGCGPTSPGGNPGDDDDGDAAGGDPDATSGDPDGPPLPDIDASCGSQSQDIAVENLGDPPDLLIVLDRSGSMSAPIPMFPPNFIPKWNIMRDALNAAVSMRQDQIRFGLSEFPTDDNCAVGSTAVRVPIDLGQAPEVAAYFTGRSPNGNTPAAAGLQAALAHYNSIPVNPAGRYVLFATDGEPNCDVDDVTAAANTVAAVTALASAGVKTFVLGFGGAFVTGTVLNDAALAGQVPRPGGPPHYYAANSAGELSAALQAIAGGIIVPSCSYALATVPPVPDDVTVTLNGMPVPRSTMHTNGWDYHPDAMTITFFGSYCDQIMAGAVGNVSFSYGCPGPVID